ncbi:MAG: peptidylprolyl isomerase [Pseudomonadales bacterium]|nr:peptidylprolyl isomerase [Pseudomonadales bacterium]
MQKNTYKTIDDFKKIDATQAVFETSKGTIVLDLFREKAPLTTANFLDLIDSGFYDGIIFHRVIPGFMAQVGDPFTKEPGRENEWGMGGPNYRIMDEFDPELKHDSAGILSMANSGPNTGGSQIFITYAATPHLDGKHAVFGKLVEGMKVLESIEVGDKIVRASYR